MTEKSASRLNWTQQQQNQLRVLREDKQIKSWTLIAKRLNEIFQGKNRSGKQCRERYMNYARFVDQNQSSSKWTLNQDKILFQKFTQYGRKWVQICKQMPGRSQNCLKNRFYGFMRKISRRVARILKQNKIRQKKILRQEAYVKILQNIIIHISCLSHDQDYSQQKKFLQDFIRVAITPDQQLSSQEVISLESRIHAMNLNIRIKANQKVAMQFNIVDKVQQERLIEQEIIRIENPTCQEILDDSSFYSLDFLTFNRSVNYQLQKQVNEILQQEYVQVNFQIF